MNKQPNFFDMLKDFTVSEDSIDSIVDTVAEINEAINTQQRRSNTLKAIKGPAEETYVIKTGFMKAGFNEQEAFELTKLVFEDGLIRNRR